MVSLNTFIYIYMFIYIQTCYFHLSAFYFLRPRVFPLALGSVEHAEPVRTQKGSLSNGRGPWHVFWGVKEAHPLGEAFRPCRAVQAHANPDIYNTILTGKKMPDVSCHIWYLECHQRRQTLHAMMEKFSPTPTCPTCNHFFIVIDQFASPSCEINCKPTHNKSYCVPHLRN